MESGEIQNMRLSGGSVWISESFVSDVRAWNHSLCMFLTFFVFFLLLGGFIPVFVDDICMFGFLMLAVCRFYFNLYVIL